MDWLSKSERTHWGYTINIDCLNEWRSHFWYSSRNGKYLWLKYLEDITEGLSQGNCQWGASGVLKKARHWWNMATQAFSPLNPVSKSPRCEFSEYNQQEGDYREEQTINRPLWIMVPTGLNNMMRLQRQLMWPQASWARPWMLPLNEPILTY